MSIKSYVQLRPSYLISYQQFDNAVRGKNEKSLSALKDNQSERFNKSMSATQSRTIKRVCETWFTSIAMQPTKIHVPTFVTLTLPSKQKHDDKIIKRELLNHFVIKAKRQSNTEYYVWKAEKQKNQNIHFHVFMDKRYERKKLSKDWNEILNKLGYVDDYAKRMSGLTYDQYVRTYKRKYKDEKMRRAYNNGNESGWRNPPTTNVKSVKDAVGAIKYLSKYMGKSDVSEVINGRAWGCSDELRELSYCKILLESKEKNGAWNDFNIDAMDELNMLELYNELKWNKVEDKFCEVGRMENGVSKTLDDFCPYLYRAYKTHHLIVYKNLYVK